MGKSIDKRCCELGGVRISDLVCADEACNLEEMVNQWKSSTMSAINRLFAEANGAANESEAQAGPDATIAQEKESSKKCLSPSTTGVPSGVMTSSEVSQLLGVNVDMNVRPDAALLPRARKKCDGEGVAILEGKTSTPSDDMKHNGNCHMSKENKWSVENPFFASVNTARWLTPSSLESAPLTLNSCCTDDEWETARDVAFVELNISRSDICYQPGDSIAICAPNPTALVDVVLTRLQSLNGTLRRETVIRKSDGEELSVGELLTYR